MERGKVSTSADGSIVDFDAVCCRVRAALEPVRAHAISLHDESGDLLWLTESSMGPDEHNAVREALEAFALREAPGLFIADLGDSRAAVLLRVADSQRRLAGAIMVIVDSRHAARDARGASRFLTSRLQQAIAAFAATRPGARESAASAKPAPSPRPATPQPSTRASVAAAPVPADIDRLHAALRRTPIALHVQRLVPLVKGSGIKRYEVLLRSPSETAPDSAPGAMLKAAVDNGLGSMLDRRVVTELFGWLMRHPDVWRNHGAMFSVNLTRTALHDEHFLRFVGLCLAKAKLPAGMVAFEVEVPAAVKHAATVAGVANALHKLGCPLILDDFALRTECLGLLRLPGVKFIKLAPAVTAAMRTDKIAQAEITALVQMARVLGMHTVAKRTESASEQQWLTALGVDFVQSHALSPPVAIGSLVAGVPAKK